MSTHWPPEDVAVLRRFFAESRNEDIAERLGRTPVQVQSQAQRLGLKKSAAYRRRVYQQRPWAGVALKRAPVGAERVDSQGYTWVKVVTRPSAPFNEQWRPKHTLLWEQTYGPVPGGHLIAFRDGDRRHVVLENLVCITPQQMLEAHSIHNLPPELKEAIQLLGRVRRKLKKVAS